MTFDEKLATLFPDLDASTLVIYRSMSCDAIRNYMNVDATIYTDDVVEATYQSGILQLISNKIKFDDMDGIKSTTVSSIGITYADNKGLAITDDVKALLPPPYVRVYG
jgi:hypothetical protein